MCLIQVESRNPKTHTSDGLQLEGYAFGERGAPTSMDITALGWAQLIRLYAAREHESKAAGTGAGASGSACVGEGQSAQGAGAAGAHAQGDKEDSGDGAPAHAAATSATKSDMRALGAQMLGNPALAAQLCQPARKPPPPPPPVPPPVLPCPPPPPTSAPPA